MYFSGNSWAICCESGGAATLSEGRSVARLGLVARSPVQLTTTVMRSTASSAEVVRRRILGALRCGVGDFETIDRTRQWKTHAAHRGRPHGDRIACGDVYSMSPGRSPAVTGASARCLARAHQASEA